MPAGGVLAAASVENEIAAKQCLAFDIGLGRGESTTFLYHNHDSRIYPVLEAARRTNTLCADAEAAESAVGTLTPAFSNDTTVVQPLYNTTNATEIDATTTSVGCDRCTSG